MDLHRRGTYPGQTIAARNCSVVDKDPTPSVMLPSPCRGFSFAGPPTFHARL